MSIGLASYETRIRWIAVFWALITTIWIMCPVSWPTTFFVLGIWVTCTFIPSLIYAWWRPRVPRGVPIFLRFVSVSDTCNEIEPTRNTIRPYSLNRLVQKLLAAGYQFQTVEEALEHPALKSVVMTFDGGYRDNLHNVLPILQKNNVKATFFLTNRSEDDVRYMKALEIQEAFRSGLISVSTYLPKEIPEDQIETFLDVNRKWITGVTRKTPAAVAVESDKIAPETQALIQRLGYRAAFVVLRKMHPVQAAPYAIHRQPIYREYHSWQSYLLVTRGRWRAF